MASIRFQVALVVIDALSAITTEAVITGTREAAFVICASGISVAIVCLGVALIHIHAFPSIAGVAAVARTRVGAIGVVASSISVASVRFQIALVVIDALFTIASEAFVACTSEFADSVCAGGLSVATVCACDALIHIGAYLSTTRISTVAFTRVISFEVDASSVCMATVSLFQAFLNVCARFAVATVSGLASTLERARNIFAGGVSVAIVRVVGAFINIRACFSVTRISKATGATVAPAFVRTHGIFVTVVIACRAFVLVYAVDTIAGQAFIACALSAFASACTYGQARRFAHAPWVSIAFVIFRTFARETTVCVLTRSFLARQLHRVLQTRVFPSHIFQFEINPLLFRVINCSALIHVVFAGLADPAICTFTIEIREAIDALTTVLAGLGFAFIDLSARLTVAFVASETFTFVRSESVLARSPFAVTNAELGRVSRRIVRALLAHFTTSTFILVLVTQSALPAIAAFARVLACAATKISAFTVAMAGVGNAIILVCRAGSTIPSSPALAGVGVGLVSVVGARAAVVTRINYAVINVFVAELSFKSTAFSTQAFVSAACVDALSVDAFLGTRLGTEIFCHFTPLTEHACRALAEKVLVAVNASAFYTWSFDAVDGRQVVASTIIDGCAHSSVPFEASITRAIVAAM